MRDKLVVWFIVRAIKSGRIGWLLARFLKKNKVNFTRKGNLWTIAYKPRFRPGDTKIIDNISNRSEIVIDEDVTTKDGNFRRLSGHTVIR